MCFSVGLNASMAEYNIHPYPLLFYLVSRNILTTAHRPVITILNRMQPVLLKCGVYVTNSGRLLFQILTMHCAFAAYFIKGSCKRAL